MAQSTGSRIEANLPEDRCFLNYTNYVSSTRPSRYTMTFHDAFFRTDSGKDVSSSSSSNLCSTASYRPCILIMLQLATNLNASS